MQQSTSRSLPLFMPSVLLVPGARTHSCCWVTDPFSLCALPENTAQLPRCPAPCFLNLTTVIKVWVLGHRAPFFSTAAQTESCAVKYSTVCDLIVILQGWPFRLLPNVLLSTMGQRTCCAPHMCRCIWRVSSPKRKGSESRFTHTPHTLTCPRGNNSVCLHQPERGRVPSASPNKRRREHCGFLQFDESVI